MTLELFPETKISLDELRTLQVKRLRDTLHQVYEGQAPYRAKCQAAGIHPDDFVVQQLRQSIGKGGCFRILAELSFDPVGHDVSSSGCSVYTHDAIVQYRRRLLRGVIQKRSCSCERARLSFKKVGRCLQAVRAVRDISPAGQGEHHRTERITQGRARR